MLYSFSNLQPLVDSYSSSLNSFLYISQIFIKTNLNFISSEFIQEWKTIKLLMKITYRWLNPVHAQQFINFIRLDIIIYYSSLFFTDLNQTYWGGYYHRPLTFEPKITEEMVAKALGYYVNPLIITDPFHVGAALLFAKYLFSSYLFLNLYLYSRTYLNSTSQRTLGIFSKFFITFEVEEEVGSIDDIIIIVTIFIVLFGWYFTLSFLFFNNSFFTFNHITIGFFWVMCIILLLPASVFFDFGLAFIIYIRGVAKGKTLLVEFAFDAIGTLIVLTRFLVQNIRFVLIFAAYFELFEWVYNSPCVYFFNTIFNFKASFSDLWSLTLTTSIYYALSVFMAGLLFYAYYFVHLLLLLFIQLGAYFLISFWLFFFFYTSFMLTKVEKLFVFKKYIN